jgi:lipopolysaccharide transport system ATP-binding protein
MSDDPIIQVEGLGKKYSLLHQRGERYTALRDVIANKAKRIFRRNSENGARATSAKDLTSLRGVGSAPEADLGPLPATPKPAEGGTSDLRASKEDFWALRGVSFEVRRGEVVGIIGRNGAGKSTLLKILSRITEPTEGRVKLKGRVASLLEVGTGFHPELTGRENIYLNGAILGMHRAEIKAKFDEIVNFAEVEKFLDTPVKRYSSGMYVRLAFAVAAHLEPEILLVDEVLAVGDAAFQKKCLGKMEEVSRGGRTILFVSHQMAAVQNLCQTGILLRDGRIAKSGPVAEVISYYLTTVGEQTDAAFATRKDRQGDGTLQFDSLVLADAQGNRINSLTCGASASFILLVRNNAQRELKNLRVGFGIDTDVGDRIAVLATYLAKEDFPIVPLETSSIRIDVPRLPLAAGRYRYTLYASVNGEITDWIKHAGTFDVEPGDFFGSGHLPPHGQGELLIDHNFQLVTGSGETL